MGFKNDNQRKAVMATLNNGASSRQSDSSVHELRLKRFKDHKATLKAERESHPDYTKRLETERQLQAIEDGKVSFLKKPYKNIEIFGKKWFDKVNGNTYHSVEVLVDNKLIGKTDFAYGYDDHYIQTGNEILVEKGLTRVFPSSDNTRGNSILGDAMRYEQRNNRSKFRIHAVDVTRRKDL